MASSSLMYCSCLPFLTLYSGGGATLWAYAPDTIDVRYSTFANNTENLALIQKNQPAAFEKIKIIWKSPLIPSDPLVWPGGPPERSAATATSADGARVC